MSGLFEKTSRYYATYPVNSSLRESGGAAGKILGSDGDWMLSSDVGAGLAGLEGLVQAYDVLRTDGLKDVIEAIISAFRTIDVVKIKAHTHPVTLIMLGMIHYADITGDSTLVREVERLWSSYERYGMSENFGCYNWFARYDSWTEPCAIIDAYMVALELWRHTGNSHYRDMGERIYYNALTFSQYANGGFGLQNCPGKASGTPFLQPHNDEAWWCCTMRGAEGLARVAQYSWAVLDDTVTITSLNPSVATFKLHPEAAVSLSLQTGYPFENNARITIKEAQTRGVYLKLPMPTWMRRVRIRVNGHSARYSKADGFLRLAQPLQEGDVVDFSFEQTGAYVATQTQDNTESSQFRIMYGPLLLGAGNTDVHVKKNARIKHSGDSYRIRHTRLYPICHPMDSTFSVANASVCKTKILFQDR